MFVQSILLYIVNGPREESLDISSLLYDMSSSWSKISYIVLYVSSVSSVCIDLAKILKWGDNPIITTYASFTFCKIFLFILTKFLVQSYILYMAIKNMMFYFALSVVDNEENSDFFIELLQIYYRGIYNPPRLLTLNQATLYAPLLTLTLLFLPSIICAFLFSIRATGIHSWSQNCVKNTVLLLFAVISNMSYFSYGCNSILSHEEFQKKENEETNTTIEENSYRYKSHLEVDALTWSTPPLKGTVDNKMSNTTKRNNPAIQFRHQNTINEDIEAVEQDSTSDNPIVENEVPDVKEDKKLSGCNLRLSNF